MGSKCHSATSWVVPLPRIPVANEGLYSSGFPTRNRIILLATVNWVGGSSKLSHSLHQGNLKVPPQEIRPYFKLFMVGMAFGGGTLRLP